MTISFTLDKEVPAEAAAVALGLCSDGLADALGALDIDADYLAGRGFTAKEGQTATLPTVPVTIVVGLGSSADLDANRFRRAGAALARAASRYPVLATRVLDAETVPARRPAAAQALAEGVVLGAYQYTNYKSDAEAPALAQVCVVGGGGARLAAALDLGARIGRGVALARDLVNTPGGDLTPTALAQAAIDIAEREGLEVSVLDHEGIVAAGMGGLLGVNRGSDQPARFIEIAWSPPGAKVSLALVGKGITFDSGGLSLKTAAGMTTMKDDMGGAAAILGAMSAIAAIAPKCKVTGYIPTTDNMTGGDATRVGDVLRIRNGTTVEVLNTDAEGRLVLADGLCLASEAAPDAIVDIATLTGAAVVALGSKVAALIGSHPGWVDQIADAADRTGERVWEMPLVDEYRPHLDSEVADLKNIGKAGEAGTITAALFLREFVGEGIPWAHLDIAGTAWSDADDLELTKGGTGWGVRLFLELARTFRKPARR
ncbi:MAG TPA: leucyl aminopeptidase [Acidimicrobiales bacterium]